MVYRKIDEACGGHRVPLLTLPMPGQAGSRRVDVGLGVRPFHELLYDEVAGTSHGIASMKMDLDSMARPPAWTTHPVFLGADPEELVVP